MNRIRLTGRLIRADSFGVLGVNHPNFDRNVSNPADDGPRRLKADTPVTSHVAHDRSIADTQRRELGLTFGSDRFYGVAPP